MGKAITLVVAVAAILVMPNDAGASTGEIDTATATPDWSQIAISGSVSWTGCELVPPEPPQKPPGPPEEEGQEEEGSLDPPPPSCRWTPFVTVGPGSDAAECATPGRESPDALAPGVTLAWKGPASASAGTAAFNVTEVPLDGSAPQLVCAALTESASTWWWQGTAFRPLASAVATAAVGPAPPVPPKATTPPPPLTCHQLHRQHRVSRRCKHRHRRAHHHRKHPRHRISLSQHRVVSKS